MTLCVVAFAPKRAHISSEINGCTPYVCASFSTHVLSALENKAARNDGEKALAVVKHIEALLLSDDGVSAATLFDRVCNESFSTLSSKLRREMQEVAWNYALKLYDVKQPFCSPSYFFKKKIRL